MHDLKGTGSFLLCVELLGIVLIYQIASKNLNCLKKHTKQDLIQSTYSRDHRIEIQYRYGPIVRIQEGRNLSLSMDYQSLHR